VSGARGPTRADKRCALEDFVSKKRCDDKAKEIRGYLRFVAVCERNGNIDQAEVDEWRRRILARQRFLGLDADGPQADIPTN